MSTAAARESRLQEALREQEGEASALKQQLQKLSGDFRWVQVQVYDSGCGMKAGTGSGWQVVPSLLSRCAPVGFAASAADA